MWQTPRMKGFPRAHEVDFRVHLHNTTREAQMESHNCDDQVVRILCRHTKQCIRLRPILPRGRNRCRGKESTTDSEEYVRIPPSPKYVGNIPHSGRRDKTRGRWGIDSSRASGSHPSLQLVFVRLLSARFCRPWHLAYQSHARCDAFLSHYPL